jgi:hypothetical protein
MPVTANLHPQIMWDGSDPEEVERVEKASGELFELAINWAAP